MEAGGPDRPPRADDPQRPAAEGELRAGEDRAADEHAAIRASLRALRSWLIVLALLTAIVAAVAVFALIEAREAKDAQDSTATATQADIERVRNQLRERIDGLEARVDDAPTSQRVDRLQGQIRQADRQASSAADDASTATDRAERLATRIDDLEQRIATLEAQPDGGGAPQQDGN